MPPKKKRKSGGARAVEAKHRRRAAERQRAKAAAGGAALPDLPTRARALGPAPLKDMGRAHTYTASLLLIALEEAALDPGMTPEQRRTEIARLGERLAKVLPTAQLNARIAQLEEALEKSQTGVVKQHAGAVEGRETPST